MGGGKSRWLCEEVKELSMQFPGNRGVICRYHLSDFKNSTFKTLMEVIPQDLIKEYNKTDGYIKLINGSEILYMGLSEEANVSRLKSMELGWFAIDEASEVPKSSFLLFQSRLRRILPNKERPQYFGILATNPDDCWLKDYFIHGEGGEDAVFIPSLPTDNPYLPEDYVEQLKKTYPEDWVARFLEGSWDDVTGGNRVIPSEWIKAAVDRSIVFQDKPIISCDVARFGDDEIVIQFGKGNMLVEQDISKRQSLMETVGRIINFSKKHKAQKIVVDDIGMGGGVTDRLREMGEKVHAINASQKALDETKYANLRCNMWYHAREQFANGNVSIINDPVLIRQLSAVKYFYHSTGRLQLEKKSDTKNRMDKSPDRADAFVMLLWGGKFLRDPARDFRRQVRPSQLTMAGTKKDKYSWPTV